MELFDETDSVGWSSPRPSGEWGPGPAPLCEFPPLDFSLDQPTPTRPRGSSDWFEEGRPRRSADFFEDSRARRSSEWFDDVRTRRSADLFAGVSDDLSVGRPRRSAEWNAAISDAMTLGGGGRPRRSGGEFQASWNAGGTQDDPVIPRRSSEWLLPFSPDDQIRPRRSAEWDSRPRRSTEWALDSTTVLRSTRRSSEWIPEEPLPRPRRSNEWNPDDPTITLPPRCPSSTDWAIDDPTIPVPRRSAEWMQEPRRSSEWMQEQPRRSSEWRSGSQDDSVIWRPRRSNEWQLNGNVQDDSNIGRPRRSGERMRPKTPDLSMLIPRSTGTSVREPATSDPSDGWSLFLNSPPYPISPQQLASGMMKAEPDSISVRTPSSSPATDEISVPRASTSLVKLPTSDLSDIDPVLMGTVRAIIGEDRILQFHWELLGWDLIQEGGVVHVYVSKVPRERIQKIFNDRMSTRSWALGCVFFYPKDTNTGADLGAWILAAPGSGFRPAKAIASVANGTGKRPICHGEWRERGCRKNSRTFVNRLVGLRAWFSIDAQEVLFLNSLPCSRSKKRARTQGEDVLPSIKGLPWPAPLPSSPQTAKPSW